MHGENKHRRVWAVLADLFRDLHPVEEGQGVVDDGDIGRCLDRLSDGFLAIRRFGHHFPAWSFAQERPQAEPNDVVIIGDQDGCHCGLPPWRCAT